MTNKMKIVSSGQISKTRPVSNGMRLLICTQVVDKNDPTLGFFLRWIEEFSKYCGSISIICLYKGMYELPANVHVYSLEKEKGKKTRFGYSMRLFQYLWKLRGTHDAVFVHMNPEYAALAGWWWRLSGVRIGLWYTHKNTRLLLRIAALFSHVIFTASRESFRLRSWKVQVVGHGIDTDFFTPDPHIARGGHVLSVGRLMKSKRHDLAIQMAVEEQRDIRIAGVGPEREALEMLAHDTGAHATFLGRLTQVQLRDEYRTASKLIHTSETGSLDKVVLEALACGCPVKTLDPALKKFESETPAYVREHHSLTNLIPKILEALR